MAVLDNGYADDAVVYAYAKARFPANFILPSPDNIFRGSMYSAGDILNSNDERFIGEAAEANTGDRAWPRAQREGVAIDAENAEFLDGVVPDDVINAYQWLAIAIAMSPELFGTSSSSSSDLITTGGGLTGFSYDNIRTEYSAPSEHHSQSSSVSTRQLHYQFRQALNYIEKFLLPGRRFIMPGLDQIVRPENEHATISQFNVVRG